MPINLGRKMEAPEAAPEPTKSSEMCFPSLYIDGEDSQLAELPESGEMTVKFKKTSHTATTRNGKKSTSVCLDILSIENIEPEAEEAGEEETTEDALDKAAAAEKAAQEEDEE